MVGLEWGSFIIECRNPNNRKCRNGYHRRKKQGKHYWYKLIDRESKSLNS